MAQALRMALHYGEAHMGVKDIFGEDVGPPLGGVFTVTQGLKTSWNSPLDERGIVGMATGIAMTKQRCVAEVQFCDYIFNTIDLLKLAGNTCWSSNGQFHLPLVLMTPDGSGIHGSIYHSHSFTSWATRLAGWKVVTPSNPLDAYGLMLSSIEDPNPVLFLKPKALLRVKGRRKIPGEPEQDTKLKQMIDAPLGEKRKKWKPSWPKLEPYKVPLGKARVMEEGEDLTLVSYGRMIPICEKASAELKKEGFKVELIDLRTLYPYDWKSISSSIKKTHRVLFVNEDTEVGNFCEHLSSRVTDEFFYTLHARPQVLSGKNLPGIGLHDNLEKASVPSLEEIVKKSKEILKEVP